MKFERLLQVYWTKGFLYGGDVVPFETTLNKLHKELPGLNRFSFSKIIKKLEFSAQIKKNPLCSLLSEDKPRIINTYLAQVASVNTPLNELEQLVTVRYYLIKSYRGYCQALGKPCRGQRTWSNAATAYKNSNHIRDYIAKFKKTHIKVEIKKKTNYQDVQRKFRKAGPKFLKKVERKPATLWL